MTGYHLESTYLDPLFAVHDLTVHEADALRRLRDGKGSRSDFKTAICLYLRTGDFDIANTLETMLEKM